MSAGASWADEAGAVERRAVPALGPSLLMVGNGVLLALGWAGWQRGFDFSWGEWLAVYALAPVATLAEIVVWLRIERR